MKITLTDSDAYKISHKGFMDPRTELVYSNLTARSSKYLPVLKEFYDNKALFFGLQYFIKNYLIEEWNNKFFNRPKEEVLRIFKRRTDTYLGPDSVSMDHFAELHDLGYLPIEIKAIEEGVRLPIKVPFLTVINTDTRFAWLTNYLETIISCELWKPIVVATLSFEFYKMLVKFAHETVGNTDGVMFQSHGFEFRGMSGRHDAAICGAATLLTSWGTDTIPAIDLLEEYYNANAENEPIAFSVPASEHMVTSLGTSLSGELDFFRKAITEHYPTGIVSLVSDTYDFFKVVTEFATELKDDILNRKPNALGLAKVVFRPDSGNPVDIVCGIPIPVLDNEKYVKDLESAKDWVKHLILDKVHDETPHGECGPDTEEGVFKFQNKTYKIVVEIEWNRYDKQYYYVDGSRVVSCEEIELTPEQKGAVECLWDVFGGTVSDKGFKTLHERVGLIYGDSITQPIAHEILKRLKEKGFASNNIVFGVGSYTRNMLSRDSLGIAIKGTWAQVDGVGYELFKDPKTDEGTKKSARGLLKVEKLEGAHGSTYVLKDQVTPEEEAQSELKTVFKDGKLFRETSLAEIRTRLTANL